MKDDHLDDAKTYISVNSKTIDMSGVPITQEMVQKCIDELMRGFDWPTTWKEKAAREAMQKALTEDDNDVQAGTTSDERKDQESAGQAVLREGGEQPERLGEERLVALEKDLQKALARIPWLG